MAAGIEGDEEEEMVRGRINRERFGKGNFRLEGNTVGDSPELIALLCVTK